jgi:hypothetical protein
MNRPCNLRVWAHRHFLALVYHRCPAGEAGCHSLAHQFADSPSLERCFLLGVSVALRASLTDRCLHSWDRHSLLGLVEGEAVGSGPPLACPADHCRRRSLLGREEEAGSDYPWTLPADRHLLRSWNRRSLLGREVGVSGPLRCPAGRCRRRRSLAGPGVEAPTAPSGNPSLDLGPVLAEVEAEESYLAWVSRPDPCSLDLPARLSALGGEGGEEGQGRSAPAWAAHLYRQPFGPLEHHFLAVVVVVAAGPDPPWTRHLGHHCPQTLVGHPSVEREAPHSAPPWVSPAGHRCLVVEAGDHSLPQVPPCQERVLDHPPGGMGALLSLP